MTNMEFPLPICYVNRSGISQLVNNVMSQQRPFGSFSYPMVLGKQLLSDLQLMTSMVR